MIVEKPVAMSLDTLSLDQMPAVSLEERRDTLYARLDSGFDKIEQAMQAGEDVTRWEHGWERLLREYEHVCEQIAARRAAPGDLDARVLVKAF
jgi:hypothetical protein